LKPHFGKSNLTEEFMFKRLTILFLAIAIFTTASSISAFGNTKSVDETKNISQKAETKNDKVRETFLKKESQPNYNAKDNMATYQKQKAQKSMFSTKTKIMIGVGIAAAIIVVVLVANDGFKEAANQF
jgi:Flp pilus assembly protein TadB